MSNPIEAALRADLDQRNAELDEERVRVQRLTQELMKWRAYARAAWELIDHIVRMGNG